MLTQSIGKLSKIIPASVQTKPGSGGNKINSSSTKKEKGK